MLCDKQAPSMSGLTWRRISCHTTLTTIHPAVVRSYLHTLEGQVKGNLEFPQETRSIETTTTEISTDPGPPGHALKDFLKTFNLFLLLCSFPWPNGPCG